MGQGRYGLLCCVIAAPCTEVGPLSPGGIARPSEESHREKKRLDSVQRSMLKSKAARVGQYKYRKPLLEEVLCTRVAEYAEYEGVS